MGFSNRWDGLGEIPRALASVAGVAVWSQEMLDDLLSGDAGHLVRLQGRSPIDRPSLRRGIEHAPTMSR